VGDEVHGGFDRNAPDVVDFFFDDRVIVLDRADVAGFVLVDDQPIDLPDAAANGNHGDGVDDAGMVDLSDLLDDRLLIVLPRRTIDAIAFARGSDGRVGGGQSKHQYDTSYGEFPNGAADHDRPLDCLREWLGINLAVRRPDVRICGLTG
jgi:hypothetical protein